MASSSLSSPPLCNYDVFLSFRGEDTRRTIVSHLYAALGAKGIITFKDDQNLEIGDHISNHLRKAIEGSKFAVVVLSEKYTTSRWCLMELQLIMELYSLEKLKVLPIFYEVDPSHVRHQRGSFGLERYQGPELTDIVQKWREALNMVANLSGIDSRRWVDEAMMLEGIVEDISSRLASMQPTSFEDLVGMEAHMEHIRPLLKKDSDSEVCMVGIWGMGGVGKTTIANYLYEQLASQFPAHCFIEDVDQLCKKFDLKYIQQQLLCDILSTKRVALMSIQNGAKLIRSRLGTLKVLFVLDGVDKVEQLHALAKETSWFGPGSRIIITTRDKRLLDSCRVTNKYEVKCLQIEDSLKMFKNTAFAGGVPPFDAYEQFAIRASQLAQGLPLALVAFGSSLRGATSIDEWEDVIDTLETAPHQNIMDILRSSYTNLDLRNKTIFIRIACLFNGEPVSRVSALLSETEKRIQGLAEKSLIHISSDGYIDIHSLIKQMAREIVAEESCYIPRQQRILWDPHNSYGVLESKTETERIEGMSLHMCELPRAASIDGSAFEQMHNLMFFKFFKHLNDTESKLNINSKNCMVFPRSLRLFQWDAYPLTTLPPTFSLVDLVELHLRYSNLESLWDGKMPLLELRMLDVTGSKNLTKLPDLSRAPKLEELIAKGCTMLEQIPETIGSLPSLKKLDVSDCDRLINLHMIIGELPALQKCSPGPYRQAALNFPDAVVTLNTLKNLAIHGKLNFWLSHLRGKADHLSFSSEQWPYKLLKTATAPKKLPKSMAEFYGLKSLDIMQFNYSKDSASFQCYSFSHFLCLTELNLINLNIERIPDDIGLLEVLQKLDLSGNDFTCLPRNMENMSSMKSLRLCNCLKLLTLPELPQLETLKLSNCMHLQSPLGHSAVRKDGRRYRLRELWLDNCNDVYPLSHTFSHCTNLTHLDLSGNHMVTMPVTIRLLTLLNTLCLNDCKKLKSMVQLPPHLTSLYARGCTSLETIYLPLDHSIKHLDLSYCPQLNEVGNLIDRFLNYGQKEEVSQRFACLSGSKVPIYFDYQANEYTREMWHASEVVGFDACIIIACQSPYIIQFSSSSYTCKQQDNRSYRINLKPDFVLPQESTSSNNEGEGFSAHHMFVFHIPSNSDLNEFCFEPNLLISEEFQSTPGRIISYGVRVILNHEEDGRDYENVSKKRKKGYVRQLKDKDDDPAIDLLISFK